MDQDNRAAPGRAGGNELLLLFLAVYGATDVIANGYRLPSGLLVGLALVAAAGLVLDRSRSGRAFAVLAVLAVAAGVAGPFVSRLG